MPVRHLTPQLVAKLLKTELSTEEAHEIALHLLASCPDCADAVETAREALGDIAPAGGGEPWTGSRRPAADSFGDGRSAGPDQLDAIFTRLRLDASSVVRGAVKERLQAPARLQELLALPAGRRGLLAFNDRRFQTLAVVDLVLEHAWECGLEEAAAAEEFLELGLQILDRVESHGTGEGLCNDLRGRAWALRGNVQRILSDYRASEESFARARMFLAAGTGDLLERARLLGLESTLWRVHQDHERAAEVLEEAAEIYAALEERHLLGRTKVNQALLLNERGEAAEAIEVLREAQSLIDPQQEPFLERIVQQNLVVYLSELGRYEEAMSLLPGLRRRVVAKGTRTELLRLRWQEGKIHVGLGNDRRAEAAFLEVRRGFIEMGLAYDVASVSLELAALYMRQRRTGEIRRLAEEMFPIFQSRDLHQEAVAALLLFQKAVDMDTLTLRMVEEVADVVRRSQQRPRPKAPEPS